MRTLTLEQISELVNQHEVLIDTARAGATLASMVRGAIRACDQRTDPTGRTKEMLAALLVAAGFEIGVGP